MVLVVLLSGRSPDAHRLGQGNERCRGGLLSTRSMILSDRVLHRAAEPPTCPQKTFLVA